MGEQRVAEEIPPLVYAAYRQGRFDWVAHLSVFQMEEAKHGQFFQYWLQEVYGTVEPEELVPHLHMEKETKEGNGKYDDPTWLAMVVVDTCEQWGDIFPGLQQAYQHSLQDEARHVGGGAHIIREILEEDPQYEPTVREVLEGNGESLIGFISYQLANPELDLQPYQELKARQYRQRCREMGIEPNKQLLEQIRDSDANFARV